MTRCVALKQRNVRQVARVTPATWLLHIAHFLRRGQDETILVFADDGVPRLVFDGDGLRRVQRRGRHQGHVGAVGEET